MPPSRVYNRRNQKYFPQPLAGEVKPPTQFHLLPKIINGGIAGIIGVTCVFPLDLVKTRLQNQKIGPNGERLYTSILDCFRKTIKQEGFFGMYRGSFVNLVLITPEKAIKLAANDYFRYKLTHADGKLPVASQVLAGALAGAFQIVVTTPMELLKIQMQDAGRVAAEAKRTGETVKMLTASALIKQLLRDHGILGFYKGIAPTAMRDITFSGIYFSLFAYLNSLGPRRNDGSGESVFWCSFLSGLSSGSFSAFIVTPLDVIKTRIQQAETVDPYKSIYDCFKRTLSHEGVLAFFKGGLCRVMVIAPLFGIAQMTYLFGIAERLMGIYPKAQ